MATLKTEVCGVRFERCIINAAGSRDHSIENLHEIGASQSGAIVIKSVTREPREGNPEPRVYWFENGGINAMGIPSLGYDICVAEMPRLLTYQKPVIVSLSAMKPSDLPQMIRGFSEAGASMLEIEVSCPNVEGKGVIAYEPEMLREVLTICRDASSIPIGPKLPPYLHKARIEQVAQVVKEVGMDFVTTSNTLGQGLIIDQYTQRKVVVANDGLGGLSGPTIKPFALANVYTMHKILGETIPIIGVGGVHTGRDVFEHLLAGASVVGVATTFIKEGPQVFERLEHQLAGELDTQRYPNPVAARGKLQNFS